MRSRAPLLIAALAPLLQLAVAPRPVAAGDAPVAVSSKAPGAAEGAPARESGAQRLRALQKQIEREQRAVHAVKEARASVVDSLRALDERLAGAEEARLAAERDVRSAEDSLAGTEAGIARLEEERRSLEAHLAERLRALYKFGRVGYVRVLFSSKDYQDFARRSRFLGRVVDYDAELVAEYRSRIDALGAEHRKMDASREALESRRQIVAARENDAEARRQEKVALLSTLEQEQDAREEAIRDLERSAGALQGVYFRLREAEPGSDVGGTGVPAGPGEVSGTRGPESGAVAFPGLKGRLPLPADGRIIKTFGLRTDPELKTQLRSNGITVRAPYGAPIRAVAGGRVLYAGWFRGYGRILIVDHGEGYYTLVAHASELLRRVGDPVRAGDEIARVGDSGSLEGPIVYFEIRKEGKPLDPKEWIRS